MVRSLYGIVGLCALYACFAVSVPAGQGAGGKGDAAKGKEIFEQCAMCHSADTDEKKMGPALKGLYKKKTMTTGKAVNDANVLAQINNGGGGMPGFSDSLSAEDKANVIAYLKTL